MLQHEDAKYILSLMQGLNLVAAVQFHLHPINDNQAVLIKSLYVLYAVPDWSINA